MVRITCARRGSRWVVSVEGQLGQADVSALEDTCRHLREKLDLDLTELRGVDDHGVAALHGLAARGARLVGVSPYIQLRLEGAKRQPLRTKSKRISSAQNVHTRRFSSPSPRRGRDELATTRRAPRWQ
jgi:hypothetical protein